jgi:hypothetical protein
MDSDVGSDAGLIDLLKRVTDPRGLRGRRFPSYSMLGICILATLSGANSLRAISEWALGLSRSKLRILGITRKKPPSEAAIRKFLAKIDPVEVDELVGAWLMAQAHNTEAIAIDGKTLRGTKGSELKQCHLLSAVLHVQGLTIAQTKVEDKTNEITAIKPLLNEIDIEGSIVTLDALHTQKETARYLTEEKRADYLMTVKDNQRGLKEWKSRNANDSRRGEHRWSRLSKCRSNLSN